MNRLLQTPFSLAMATIKAREDLVLENLALRQQIEILQRTGRRGRNGDRAADGRRVAPPVRALRQLNGPCVEAIPAPGGQVRPIPRRRPFTTCYGGPLLSPRVVTSSRIRRSTLAETGPMDF